MVLPPILFWNVAQFLWTSDLILQVGPSCPPLPCYQQYFPLFLWRRSFTPPLLPPLLVPLSPILLFLLNRDSRVLMVEVRSFICSGSVVVCCVDFTIFCICSCIFWSASRSSVKASAMATSSVCRAVMRVYTSSDIVFELTYWWKPISYIIWCGWAFLVVLWDWEKWGLNALQIFCKSVLSFHLWMSMAKMLALVI